MGRVVVLNELSWQPPVDSLPVATGLLDGLAAALLEARRRAADLVVRHDGLCLQRALYGEGYAVRRWVQDEHSQLRSDERRLVLYLLTKHPRVQATVSDYTYDGANAVGLGWAAENSALAASLDREEWRQTHLVLQRTRLVESTGELALDTATVMHASSDGHMRQHRGWLTEPPCSWEDLWQRWSLLYPYLDVVDGVRGAARLHQEHVNALHRKLSEIDDYFADGPREITPFDARQLHLRDEKSQTVKRRGPAQWHMCPDGIKRRFDYHFSVGRNRCYLIALNRRGLVGYLDLHP